jgi:GT2 family glycosyltransferase/glycosyltransferase involved in cell wall biosynthesis
LLEAAGAVAQSAAVSCPPGPLADGARSAGLPVVTPQARSMELRRSVRDRAGHAARLALHGREAAALARDLDAGVVVAWGMRSLLALSAALPRRLSALVFAHNDLLPSPGVAATVRAAARRADRVVALSHTVAEDLDPDRTTVIHPGVDLEARRPDAPADPPYALVLGAIEPWKRPELALEAVARVPGLRVVLAGEPIGTEGERLRARVAARAREPDLAGRVDLRGQVADPAPLLAGASVLLHCADHEPFGIAMIEALAAGVPVVAPAAAGPTEIVTKACGRLFPAGDERAAAEGIRECLEQPAMRRAARDRACDFDVRATRRAWRDVLSGPDPLPSSPAVSPSLALVTVTHNSQNDLQRLLASAARHLAGVPITAVDAGSADASAEVARAAGAVVLERDNVGYGAAANAGVAACDADVAVILNPDVETVDDSLLALGAEAARTDRILVPLVLRPDGTRQDIAHNGPAGWSDLAIALGPPAALPPALRTAVQPWRAHEPRRVDWPVAACLAGRTETLRRLGPFDPAIFLYSEDMDLGLRAREAGVETWFWPAARVIHHQSHATTRAFGGEPFERLARQRHAVVARRLGERAAARDDAMQALTFANRAALKGLLRRPAARERAQLRAVRAARRS